jgi:hypothetical protein
MYNNQDTNQPYNPHYTHTIEGAIALKDAHINLIRVWFFFATQFLFVWNWAPILMNASITLWVSTWHVGLITITTFLTFLIVVLLFKNPLDLVKLLHNEFFLVLLLYLPGFYTLLVCSFNIVLLYVLVEAFAVLLLILLYTSQVNSADRDQATPDCSKTTFYLVFYQFIFNFYSSFIFALLMVILFSYFGVISYTQLSPRLYSLHMSNINQTYVNYLAYDHYIPLCFIFFFLIKFGVGP